MSGADGYVRRVDIPCPCWCAVCVGSRLRAAFFWVVGVSVPVVPDLGPMARLEDVKRDEGAAAEVFRLLTEPDEPRTLKEIAKAWRVPRGRFVEWFTTQHKDLYDAALKVRTEELANEALSIADEQAAVEKKDGSEYDPDVPRDKLRVDTRLKLAEKWDRARYGAQVKVEHAGAVAVDAGLLGAMGEVLRLATEGRKVERLVESVPEEDGFI